MHGRDVSANGGQGDEGRLKEGRGTLKGGRGTLKGGRGTALRLVSATLNNRRSGAGARDGFLTEKENSPESDKGTRRRGDKGTRILLTGFLLTC